MNDNIAILTSLYLGSLLFFSFMAATSAQASMGGAADDVWEEAYTVGKFLNSEPRKPDQIFKIHYRAINATVESFSVADEIASEVTSGGNGALQIKFPRNYPYTNDIGENGAAPVIFVNEGLVSPRYNTTECFFEFSIPFAGSSVIGLSWAYLAVEQPYHGDSVLESCLPQTTVESVPIKRDGTISPLQQLRAGVAAEDIACPEDLQLLISPKGKSYCAGSAASKTLVEWWNLPAVR